MSNSYGAEKATAAGAAIGGVGAISAVATAGPVAGLGAAGITSGLAAVGGVIGFGMAAGLVLVIAAPVLTGGLAYGLYKWYDGDSE